jgi:hypothetical protein
MKLLQFKGSNSIHQSSCSGNKTVSESEYSRRYTGNTVPKGVALSNMQCLWCFPVRGPTIRSLDLPLVAALGITGRKRETTWTQIIQ